jgi:hypothetical protein
LPANIGPMISSMRPTGAFILISDVNPFAREVARAPWQIFLRPLNTTSWALGPDLEKQRINQPFPYALQSCPRMLVLVAFSDRNSPRRLRWHSNALKSVAMSRLIVCCHLIFPVLNEVVKLFEIIMVRISRRESDCIPRNSELSSLPAHCTFYLQVVRSRLLIRGTIDLSKIRFKVSVLLV